MRSDLSLLKEDATRLPLLGTKANGEVFTYLLLCYSKDEAEIAICDWFVNRARIHPEETLELFFSPNFGLQSAYTPAKVVARTHEESINAMKYKLIFNPPLTFSEKHPICNEQEPIQLLLQILKDSIYLKKGIRIYLKHLAPYFSRISNFKKHEYSQLKEFLFLDMNLNAGKNEENLQKLFNSLEEESKVKNSNFFSHLNLENLRACIETEISYDLIEGVFKGMIYKNSYDVYFESIKVLEKRLYINYNKIVMIYQHYLSS